MVSISKSGLKFSRQSSRGGSDGNVVFDQYEPGMPSHQKAIDLLPGWTGSFPPDMKLQAGSLALHNDHRIAWLIKQMGSLADKTIMEIGPLEGMHTYMLAREKPKRIDAVEANRLCYLRCLITKQILGIPHARFLLGDAVEWLRDSKIRYDLIVASGVLYHMAEPAELLRLMAENSDAIFLWTHYYTEDSDKSEPWRTAFSGKVEKRELNGVTVHCYERSYQKAATKASFCGGPW